MLEGIEAILFDLDGTLVDSMGIWKQIDVEYLGKFGIEVPKGLQDKIEGMSFSETANYFKNTFHIPQTIEEMKNTWNFMAYEKYRLEVPLKEGALEFLQYLKEHHIKAGIATSNSRELVNISVESLHVDGYFQSIRTACEVNKGKPAPDLYLRVAQDLDVEPECCLVMEDLPAGILAGKNARMRTCAIWDKNSEHLTEKKKELADYYVNSFIELMEKIG